MSCASPGCCCYGGCCCGVFKEGGGAGGASPKLYLIVCFLIRQLTRSSLDHCHKRRPTRSRSAGCIVCSASMETYCYISFSILCVDRDSQLDGNYQGNSGWLQTNLFQDGLRQTYFRGRPNYRSPDRPLSISRVFFSVEEGDDKQGSKARFARETYFCLP